MASPTSTVNAPLTQGSIVTVTEKGEDKQVTVAARITVYDETDPAIAAAIASGEVFRDENVLVKIEDEYVVYTELLAKTLSAAQALCGGPVDLVLNDDGTAARNAPSVMSNFNYGLNLNAKRKVRQDHQEKAQGPGRTISAAIKNLMNLGFSKEEAEAVAKSKLG